MPLNLLSMFGNSSTLWIFMAGGNCLKIKKLKMPALSALLSTRILGFVNDRDPTWTSDWELVTQRGGPGKTHLHLCGKAVGANAKVTSNCSNRRGSQGRTQCSVPARSALEISTWSLGAWFLAKWPQIRLCSPPRNSVNVLILPLLNLLWWLWWLLAVDSVVCN